MSWPTTRKHPRSLAEAYADVRACAIECPPRRRWSWWTVADVALAIVAGIALAWALIYGWEM